MKPAATITLSVKSSDGFESSISIPADTTDAVKAQSVSAWLEMMMVGLRTNITDMRAVLTSDAARAALQKDQNSNG